MHDGEVHPRFHLRRDEVVGRRIVRPQELECLLREHQAEAKHRVRRILLDDADAPVRMPALRQIREIDAGRPGADDEDIHLLEERPQVLELVEEMPRCKLSCRLRLPLHEDEHLPSATTRPPCACTSFAERRETWLMPRPRWHARRRRTALAWHARPPRSPDCRRCCSQSRTAD